MISGGLDILLVEDNVIQAGHLADRLPRLQNWRVHMSYSAEEALSWLAENSMDAAIVDLGLPGMSGYELCERLRTFFKGPILVLSAEHREVLRQRALACGADGYLVKPVDVATVGSSLQALIALAERSTIPPNAEPQLSDRKGQAQLTIGTLRLDPQTAILLVREEVGGHVQLTHSEVLLLEAFARAPGELVRRDDLHLALHGVPWDGHSSSIDFLLHGLRKKLVSLGGSEAHGVEIRTIRGEGFVLLIEHVPGRP